VYTCEIPDNSSTTRELNVYLYVGQVASKEGLIVYILLIVFILNIIINYFYPVSIT